MDFGGLDSLMVCSQTTNTNTNTSTSNNNNINSLITGYGSGSNIFKQERSLSTAHNQDEWRDMKVAKLSNSLYSDSQNMLSFSSPYTQQTRNTTGTSHYSMLIFTFLCIIY